MIKINLAKKKQMGLLKNKDSSVFFSLGEFQEKFKSFPIRKILLPLVSCYVAYYTLNSYKEEELKKIDRQANQIIQSKSGLEEELIQLSKYEAMKLSLEEEGDKIRNKLQTLQALLDDKPSPLNILVLISKKIPTEVWLQDVRLEKHSLLIKGSSLGFNQISDFMNELNQNSFFLNVDLKNSQKARDYFEMEIASFELKADIK